MTSTPQLILASGSPRRRELLGQFGLTFSIQISNVEERFPEGPVAVERIASDLARQKAAAVARKHPEAVVLAADTIVATDGELLGKPGNPDEAHRMLQGLRSTWHTVTTGVALICDQRLEQKSSTTQVLMRDYTDAEIEASIASGSPFDKAGGYAIQDQLFQPVASYQGCHCNVIGLPLATTIQMLEQAGIPAPESGSERLLPACETCPLFDADRSR